MKIATVINQIVVRLICAATSAVCLPVFAGVTTYSAPPGEAVTGDYAVEVNGKPVDVYAAQSEFFEGDYYFASFDFAGKAEIRVTSAAALDNVVIQPALRRPDRTEGFQGNHPFGRRAVPHLDRTQRPDQALAPVRECGGAQSPRPGDPNVVYFAPGVHRPGKIALTDNQTLYLAGGAVVKGCVHAKGTNITIRGRGILGGEESPRFQGPGRYLLDCQDCQNLTVRTSRSATLGVGPSSRGTATALSSTTSRFAVRA